MMIKKKKPQPARPNEQLRQIRTRLLCTSQAKLAAKLGVQRTTVVKWESGAQPIGNWTILSMALAYLYSQSGSKTKNQNQTETPTPVEEGA